MPTIKGSDMVGEEPSEESSLQISTSPEQIVSSVPSRALHVRKSNTKQSAESSSRSSSARSSSRPPTGAPSHRGPGTVALTKATSQELPLRGERAIRSQDHRTFVHNPDQRAMQVNVLNQDQRSMQVDIGVDPEQVVAVAREAEIMSQAHAAVNAARSQLGSETSAMLNQVASIQHEAQSHTQSVEFRAGEIVSQMQTQHARELNHVKHVANEAHSATSEQLTALKIRNELLMKQLQEQQQQLVLHKEEQKQLRGVIGGLNDQITFKQSQAHASIPCNLPLTKIK